MPLITIVVVLLVVGVLMWLAETYIPLSPPFRTLLRAVVIIVVVLWLLSVFGLLDLVRTVRVGPAR